MKKACSKILFFTNSSPLSSKSGFTLVELLLAMSIIGILSAIGIAQYLKFNRQQILNQAVIQLRIDLANAQNMALAGKKECTGAFDGVKVEFEPANDTYKMYSSCDDKTVSGPEKTYYLPQGVEIENYPSDGILFKVLTGGTDLENETTINLSLTGIPTRWVTVTPVGKIE